MTELTIRRILTGLLCVTSAPGTIHAATEIIDSRVISQRPSGERYEEVLLKTEKGLERQLLLKIRDDWSQSDRVKVHSRYEGQVVLVKLQPGVIPNEAQAEFRTLLAGYQTRFSSFRVAGRDFIRIAHSGLRLADSSSIIAALKTRSDLVEVAELSGLVQTTHLPRSPRAWTRR